MTNAQPMENTPSCLPTNYNPSIAAATRKERSTDQYQSPVVAMIEAIANGDSEAEDALARHCERFLRPHINIKCAGRSWAEDLFQDTFINVLIGLRSGRLRNPQKLNAYIFRTAQYLLFAELRKADRLDPNIDIDSISHSMEDFPDAAKQIDNDALHNALCHSIDQLRMDRDKMLIRCAGLEGASKLELRSVLLLSSTHFDRVMHRARSRMKTILADEYPWVVESWLNPTQHNAIPQLVK